MPPSSAPGARKLPSGADLLRHLKPPPPLSIPCGSPARPRLSHRQCQRLDAPHHGHEKPPREVTLRQQEPVIARVLHQPSARLHQSLLQARQRPVAHRAAAALAAATGSPGHRRSRSAKAASRSTGTDGNSAGPSSLTTLAIVHGARGSDPLGCAASIPKRTATPMTVAKSLSHQRFSELIGCVAIGLGMKSRLPGKWSQARVAA